MRSILIIFVLMISINCNAAVVERPSKEYKNYALEHYEWMVNFKKALIYTEINDGASKFINDESLKRYFKLKIRNFIKEVKIIEDTKGTNYDYNYLSLKVELYKYNDTLKIYYGLLSLKLNSSLASAGKNNSIYEITTSIAGSESQLATSIKQEIDRMVEIYAEDYYFIEDLKVEQSIK